MKQDCEGHDPEIDGILNRALDGRPPTKDESCALINANLNDLQDVVQVASTIRDREKGLRISYSKKVFIPLTNMCRNRCGYCGFRKDPEHPEARIMSPEEILNLARKGDESRCKEALFVLGEAPEYEHPKARNYLQRLGYSTIIEYLRDMCEMVTSQTRLLPHSNPGVLSNEDLAILKDVNASMGLMLESSSKRLCNRGGAHEHSPGKNPEVRLRSIEVAGQLKIPFTTGILIGVGETLEERIDSLFDLKLLHDKYRHIQEIIIQNFKAQPQTPMELAPQPTMIDMVKTVAAARLIFQGKTNIQSPPNLLQGAYRDLLCAGINDWGGVSNLTKDLVNPEAPWPEIDTLRKVTNEAGFELILRLPVYPEYIVRMDGYLPSSLEEKIRSQVDSEGFARGPAA
jgi:7,8-didemethyl-8-hydroxy-5-deazariboflavin synthase CofG subunit